MYQVGNRVLYGAQGICTVVGIESMRFGKTRAKYYCLQPAGQPEARYFVPVDNASAVAKMRPLMTTEEIMDLLHSEIVREGSWIAEENLRKQRYRELLSNGDMGLILQMIYTVYRHKEELVAAGRKLHLCDEAFLKDAERVLNSEFCCVLEIEQGSVRDLVVREMGL